MSTDVPPLELIPLGGVGEFGMNMMVIACGETAILVDAGVMFPEPELLGVDLVIPDLRQLQQYPIKALVLTHGHEDHIGAVPHVLPCFEGPVYGTALTLALVESKLEAREKAGRDRLIRVRPRERVTIGAFSIEFLRVTHSMPDCVALAITTPHGVVIHTGDFKIDQTPLDGDPMDVHRLAELGSAGVLALLADSTNVDRKGFSGSEVDVTDAFEEIFTGATGKIVVAMFASSLYRMQILVDLAAQFDRRVAFVGRGVIDNSEIGAAARISSGAHGRAHPRLGGARIPPAQDVVCICTGSQGEPQAALPRIAINDHRHVRLEPDDVVVFSAREIPGNEKAIGRVMNHIARRHAEVVYEGIKHVHVSGHGSEEELKLVLSLVRPRYFVPIHGEYRQLARHARIASRVSRNTTVLLAENGDVIRFDAEGGRLAGKVPAGPGPDRRDAQRRGRRRSAPGPPSPVRRRPGGCGGEHRPAFRYARGDARRDYPRIRARRREPKRCSRRFRRCWRRRSTRPASRSAPTRDSSRRRFAWTCSGSSGSDPASGHSSCRS